MAAPTNQLKNGDLAACKDCLMVDSRYWNDPYFRSPSLDRALEASGGVTAFDFNGMKLQIPGCGAIALSSEYVPCPRHLAMMEE